MNASGQPSTKASTLASLEGKLQCARILPMRSFTIGSWIDNPAGILDDLEKSFPDTPVIVRSSALNEDAELASMAGHYASVLNVHGRASQEAAIHTVMASYGSDKKALDEILIQPMLTATRLSGVAFSHDPSTGAPYVVINYAVGGDTSAVTAGTGEIHTFVAAENTSDVAPDMARIIALIRELQTHFPGMPLDIEFAFDGPDDTLYLLQSRPLVMPQADLSAEQHQRLLKRIAEKVRRAQQPHPFLHGSSTVFGVMPDWNPAEIIGIRPRPLALSLYRELVTDATWAYQRNNYGYRNLRSFPLLVHFVGQPYIDVRVSFNSFIPKDIEGTLAHRLVDYYVDRLVAAPALHDKIEFEIVFSCYTLDLPQRLEVLTDAGFSLAERTRITDSLRVLTNRIIDRDNGLWREDAERLVTLEQRRGQILASRLDPLSRIYWLLEDCKRYGTLPFAGLARAGFIAVQMLRSLVAIGVFTEQDYDLFMNGLNTVSTQLSRDLGNLERSVFLTRYGHLRPGTYDILSQRYDEAPDAYLACGRHHSPVQPGRNPFTLKLEQMRAIARLLQEHGLSCDVVGLFDFLQAGIELREHAKFIFTRNLSDAMSLFRDFGAQYGFSTDDMSYANIGCITELYAGSDDPEMLLARSIAEGKARYRETCQVWLPPLITRPEDVLAFHVPDSEPNFVTQTTVTAAVTGPDQRDQLRGAIVCISSADPGYDWLFSHAIAGLVTEYGGVNSHMAIRANELGLPAVIGAGTTLFKRWTQARRLHIDCANRRVEIVQ